MTAITPEFSRQSRLDFHRRMRDEKLAAYPEHRDEIEAYYQRKLAEEGLHEDPTPRPEAPSATAPEAGPGRVGGAARSAAQGLTFGFSDELRGVAQGLVPGGETYTSARDKEREALQSFKRSHPVLANAAEIAGGVTGTYLTGGMGRAAQGVGAIQNALKARQALTGAKAALPYAAAYSLGTAEGSPVEQAMQTGAGTAIGAAAGAAAPWAMDKVVGAGSGALNMGRRLLGRAVPDAAEQTGAARVLTQLTRDQLTPADAAAKVKAATAAGVDDVALADLGPNLRGDLDWAANVPGSGQRTVVDWAKKRDASMRRLMKDAYQAIVGRSQTSPAVQAETIAAVRSQAGNELFEPVFAQVNGVDDPAVLGTLQDALNVDGVFRRAVKVARSWKQPIKVEAVTADGEVTKVPTYRFAHYVKTQLSEMAEQAVKNGDNQLAAGLRQREAALRGALVDALKVPYEEALANHAALSSQIDALQLGTKMLQDNIDPALLAKQLLSMDEATQQAFRTGADAAIRKKLSRGAMGKRLSNAWWMDDAIQTKLRLVMGDDELQRFLRLMDVSADKQLTHNIVGSQTFGRSARDLDATLGREQAMRTALTNPAAAVRTAGATIAKELEQRQRERVAGELPQWLTAQGPDLLRRLTDLDLVAQGLLGQYGTQQELARQAGTYFGGSR